MLKKIAISTLALLLASPLLTYAGFKWWVSQQPEEMRATIESMSLQEFAQVLYMNFNPPAMLPASDKQRKVAGRGHSPWLMRSALDGRSRILSIALAPGIWLSYNTEFAYAYQFWRGELRFRGPPYDGVQGREPCSEGQAWFSASARPDWMMHGGDAGGDESSDESYPATVQYLGHEEVSAQRAAQLPDGSFAVVLRYSLSSPLGEVTVEEAPELVRKDGQLVLQRQFRLTPAASNTGPLQISIPVSSEVDADNWVYDNASLRRLDSSSDSSSDSSMGSRIVLRGPEATLVQRFDDKLQALPGCDNSPLSEHGEDLSHLDAGDREALGLLQASDCSTCHHSQERVTGPSWADVAGRYASHKRRDAISHIASKIRAGGAGVWGQVPMPPHADINQVSANAMASFILKQEPTAGTTLDDLPVRQQYAWTYDSDVEAAPARLHPALQLESLLPVGFRPKVGGLAELNGRLLVSTWDKDGAIYLLDYLSGYSDKGKPDKGEASVQRIAEGLQEPLGLASVGERIFVMQKQEVTELLDNDGDGWYEEHRVVSNAWIATSNFHEFGFGLGHHEGYLYGGLSACVLYGGKNCIEQTADRGKLFRVAIDTAGIGQTSELEVLARGLRTPNGISVAANGDIYVTDNQGEWLPSSKLLHIPANSSAVPWFGVPITVADRSQAPALAQPALWLPQNEVGNSPTQPLQLPVGTYAGQMIWGDVFNGGLKRGFLETVNGRQQGAAFHFSGGLRGAAHRLLLNKDGEIIVGEIGHSGNWNEFGKEWFGLERLRFTASKAFEPLAVRAQADGFDIELTQALHEDIALKPTDLKVSQWFYAPTAQYGGPKYDVTTLTVTTLDLSPDRKRLRATIPGLKAGYVVYLHLDKRLRSQAGLSLWVNEAWYTLNALPAARSVASAGDALLNRLSDKEKQDGWRLLFNGKDFTGWRNYGVSYGKSYGEGKDNAAIKGWAIENGSLKLTETRGLVWRFINPFGPGIHDLLYDEKFENFELSIDWKIAAAGNSGIFYAIPHEDDKVSWFTALEMQVLDNAAHSDGKIEKHRAGDLYDLVASSEDATRPVGEWNTARIRVNNNRIQHWLNGTLVVDIERFSDDWDKRVAASKFDNEDFGMAQRGFIALQDHGDTVWFRNIKLRELPSIGAAKK